MIGIDGIEIEINTTRSRFDITRSAKRLVERTCDRIVQRARVYAPERSGFLRSRIVARPVVVVGNQAIGRVVADTPYAYFQHEGTGLWGPKRRRIVPRRAKALRFPSPTGQVVFARSVKGVRGSKFLTRAVREVCVGKPWDVEYLTDPLP